MEGRSSLRVSFGFCWSSLVVGRLQSSVVIGRWSLLVVVSRCRPRRHLRWSSDVSRRWPSVVASSFWVDGSSGRRCRSLLVVGGRRSVIAGHSCSEHKLIHARKFANTPWNPSRKGQDSFRAKARSGGDWFERSVTWSSLGILWSGAPAVHQSGPSRARCRRLSAPSWTSSSRAPCRQS